MSSLQIGWSGFMRTLDLTLCLIVSLIFQSSSQYYLISIKLQKQNNMNKTLRVSSLPHLKILQQNSFKHLIGSVPHSQRTSRPKQLMEVGPYVFDKAKLLGKGFCSCVYKAKHTKTGESVAVKIIELNKIKGALQKRMIKNEIKSLHLLRQSKNVLKLIQVLTTNQYVAFVTQLCKESLLSKERPNKSFVKSPLQKSQALKILKQILKGYYQMREHDLLHRDIKPANILIGQDGQARLGDFGFSILDDQVQQDKHVNIGSPLYMAPEVLKGNFYSSKADMWSIGLIFLEMLIGDLPWVNTKESGLHDKIMHTSMEEIIPHDLGQLYTEMLLKCLDVDPRKRIGVREMMGYLFSQEQLKRLENESRSHMIKELSNKQTKISIPTTITEGEEQKNQIELIDSCGLQRSGNGSRNLSKTNLNSFTFADHPYNRSFKVFSSKKQIRVKEAYEAKNEHPLAIKLKTKSSSQQELILKEQMSELHFCRFLFKMVELIVKGWDNIHCTYFNLTEKVCVQLSQNILYTLEQIRLIKSDFSFPVVREFRKSKEFQKILQLTEQYQSNYVQFFQIQFKTEVEAGPIDIEYLRDQMVMHLENGKDHFELIMEEVRKSQLKVISDEEICQFVRLIDFMSKLIRLLQLRKKSRQNFVRFGKIQDLINYSPASIFLSELRKIQQRLKN